MGATLTARLRVTLEQTSAILDALPGSILAALHAEIAAGGDPDKGRDGLSAAQVLRAMAIKQMTGWSYDELAFRLQDSLMLRGFCRIPAGTFLSELMLQKSIDSITPQTWEREHQVALDAVEALFDAVEASKASAGIRGHADRFWAVALAAGA